MREIKLVTNCERPPNYLMDYCLKYWLESGFKPENLIFLVNNISKFDMVKSLKDRYGIDAVRVESEEDIYNKDQCVVWDDLEEYDYGAYHDRERDIINRVQHRLLDSGVDVVIFLDRDEVLYHNNLMDVLQNFDEEVIRPRGIEVIQTGNEDPLDVSKPIHEQRSYVRYFPSKSKACITRIPINCMVGRHGTLDGRWPHADDRHFEVGGNRDEYPGLYLFHIDKVDMNLIYHLRMESQRIFKSNDRHTGVIDQEEFTEWFTEAQRDGELYEDKKLLKEIGM